MLFAGVALLSSHDDVESFFTIIEGRGLPHPWKDCGIDDIMPNIKPLDFLRGAAADHIRFRHDADILGYVISHIE